MLLSDLIAFIKKTQEDKSEKAFPWADESLGQYLSWAFSNNYLFLESDNNGISGLTIAYPLPFGSDNTIKSVLPSHISISKENEHLKEIAVMDTIFKTETARIAITKKFMERFPNWENQKKVATRKSIVVTLPNKYFKLLLKI